jgi:hypothetical protein
MQVSRGVLIVGGVALLAAWFAAAADRQDPPAAAPARDGATLDQAEALARDIEAQSARLHARLATAPTPRTDGRNPFAFDVRRATRAQMPAPQGEVSESPSAIEIPEPPPLTLSGIAEEGTGVAGVAEGAPVRIAVLSGLGDVFLARAGDTILGRYEVLGVGADAAELKDLTTGRTIRLGLR